MRRLLPLVLLLAAMLPAQTETKPEEAHPAQVQKLFILKYADPRAVGDLLRIFGANTVPNLDLHALAVTASAKSMPAIEEAIGRLDVASAAQRNFDLTVYYLVGSEAEDALGGQIPRNLDSVVAQLKNTFPFKTYRLMDVLSLRTRTGQAASTSSAAGALSTGPNALPITSQFRIRSVSVGQDGSTVRIDSLNSSTRFPVPVSPTQSNYQDLGLNSDVDIKEGQKVVIGRLSVDRDRALFLVLMVQAVQ